MSVKGAKSSTFVDSSDVEEVIYRKDRQCTDVVALIIMAVYMVGLFILVFLCFPDSNVFRVIYGYDDCGNVCGRRNIRDIEFSCSGQNKLAYKYVLFTTTPTSNEIFKSCVEECPGDGYKVYFNRCIHFQANRSLSDQVPQSIMEEIWQDVYSSGRELFWLCLLCLLVTLLMLAFLCCAPGLMISCALCAIITMCLAAMLVHWFNWKTKANAYNKKGYLITAIIFTVLVIIIFCLVGCIWKKIKFVMELLKEGGNAIRRNKLLLLNPLLTTILLLATFALGIYFILIIESTGKPAVIGNSVVYEKKALVHAARWYNIIALIWFSCFLFDCQHMVTAGAIAAWYFTRNKHGLNNAEGRSCSVLIKYHLGSVALGSLILAVTVLIRFIVKLLQKIATQTRSGYIACIALVCACIFNCIRSIVEMIQRNAYILVALQGLPFFKAGKSAVKLMMADAPNFVSVYAITNIVFLLAKWSVLLSVGSAAVVVLQMKHDLYHPYVLVAILGLVIYLITHCFMAVYEMTVATIFLCFCKDIQLNNGTDRPYYMSNNLGKFLPNAVQSETAQQNQASMS